jgi:hypothetical protein
MSSSRSSRNNCNDVKVHAFVVQVVSKWISVPAASSLIRPHCVFFGNHDRRSDSSAIGLGLCCALLDYNRWGSMASA